MRHWCCRALLLALICLAVTGCIVQVRPIPVLEIHPYIIEIHD